jgi:hypothetical protein
MDEYLIPHANFKRLYEEYKEHKSLAIAVDFDNTVYDRHSKGYLYPIVIDRIKRAQALGMKIYMFTANPDLKLIQDYMTERGVFLWGINTDMIPLGRENRKPFYSLLLDDRAGLISAMEDLTTLIEVLEDELGFNNVKNN